MINCIANKNTIIILRGKLPYLKVYDYEGYKEMKKHIESENATTSFINQLETMICEEKIDAMAFDNFDSVNAFLNIK